MSSKVLDEKSCLKQFNSKHCVVLHGSRVVITNEGYDPIIGRTKTAFLKLEDFKKLYAHHLVRTSRGKETVPATDWWFEHERRREAKGVVFDPQGTSEGFFNLWKGFSITPKKKDCSRFLDFIREVICDGDEEQY